MATLPYSLLSPYRAGETVSYEGSIFEALVDVPPLIEPTNATYWGPIAPDPIGVLPSPVGATDGYVVTVEDSAFVLAPSSGGATTLSLTYNAVTFDVPVSSLPDGWDGEGTTAMLAQLTTGDAAVSGLQDPGGNPIPDGWSFPAIIFVEDAEIFDIVALNAYQFGGAGSLVWWGSGGVPFLAIGAGGVFLPGLPTSDPGVAGQIYALANVLMQSAG